MMRCAAVLFAAAAPASAGDGIWRPGDIVVAGDSWAMYSQNGIEPGVQFERVFKEHNDDRSIRNIAVGGTTAADWAGNTSSPVYNQTGGNSSLHDQLLEAVDPVAHPDVTHLWIQCGGNDLIPLLSMCSSCINIYEARKGNVAQSMQCLPQYGEAVGDDADWGTKCIDMLQVYYLRQMREILRTVHAANPNLRVVQMSYDLPSQHFAQALGLMMPACVDGGVTGVMMNLMNGNNMTVDLNCAFSRFVQLVRSSQAQLEQEFAFFDGVDVFGSMQALRGVEDANGVAAAPGHPVLSEWSPLSTTTSDGYHGNVEGFHAVMQAFYDKYWKSQTAAPSSPPSAFPTTSFASLPFAAGKLATTAAPITAAQLGSRLSELVGMTMSAGEGLPSFAVSALDTPADITGGKSQVTMTISVTVEEIREAGEAAFAEGFTNVMAAGLYLAPGQIGTVTFSSASGMRMQTLAATTTAAFEVCREQQCSSGEEDSDQFPVWAVVLCVVLPLLLLCAAVTALCLCRSAPAAAGRDCDPERCDGNEPASGSGKQSPAVLSPITPDEPTELESTTSQMPRSLGHMEEEKVVIEFEVLPEKLFENPREPRPSQEESSVDSPVKEDVLDV